MLTCANVCLVHFAFVEVVYEIVSLTDKLMALEKKVEEQRQDRTLHKITGMLPDSATFHEQH